MTEPIPALLLALTLPWLFGSLLARWLSGPGRSAFLYLGQGYILGTLTVVWLIKTWDANGWALSFWPMAGVLLLLTTLMAAGMLLRKMPDSTTRANHAGLASRHTPGWRHGIMLLLCLAMGAHLLFVMQEVLLRPTFPWDAWRGWEPKVIQFFDNRSLEAPMRTIGNYGEISTHALLWMMLASNTTHEPFLHLPWLLAYVALAATVYGYLRERSSRLLAAIGAYLVMSLPYLNTHVALAGYADIWLALTFAVGILALSDFRCNHHYRQLVVVLLMVLACVQTKRAGIGFAAVLLVLLVIEAGLLRVSKPVRVSVGFVIIFVVGVLGSTLLGYMNLEVPLAAGRQLLLSSEELRITGLLQFTFDPDWQLRPFYEALLQFGNWHLVAYLWLGFTAVLLMRRKWRLLVQIENLGVMGGLAVVVLYFVLVFPETALDHTGLSRALLYIMPLAVAWLLTAGQQLTTKE